MGRREGGDTSQARSISPGVPTPHAAPPLPQVVAIDLDEGLNGLVSYRMQVGMPRMDFLINSSSGVVVTTTELDRERIAQYQLQVVATDAGTPTKSSTSTLTIRGEGAGCLPLCAEHTGGVGSRRVPLLATVRGGAGHPANGASPGATQHGRAFPSPPSGKASEPPSPHLATARCPRAPESERPGPTAKVPLFDPGHSREGLGRGGALRSGTAWGGDGALSFEGCFYL